MRTHQLPIEGPSGVGSLLTEQPSVVLSLGLDADGLDHLSQVDEIHELNCLVGAVCVCVCCVCVV